MKEWGRSFLLRKGLVLFSIIGIAFLISSSAFSAEMELIYGVTTPGSTGYLAPQAYIPVLSKYTDGRIKMVTQITRGASETVRMIRSGELKGGPAGPDGYWQSAYAKKAYEGKKKVKMYQLWPYTVAWWHIVVHDNSKFKTLKDLKGATVVTGGGGSYGPICTEMLFKSIGFDPEKDVRRKFIGYGAAKTAMIDKKADVLVGYMGAPTSIVSEIASLHPIRFLDVSQAVVDRVNELYFDGSEVFRLGKLSKNFYKGMKIDADAVKILYTFCVTKDVPEDITYEMTKIWWEHQDEIIENLPKLKQVFNPKLVPEMQCSYAPIASGAAKYYRERGWLK